MHDFLSVSLSLLSWYKHYEPPVTMVTLSGRFQMWLKGEKRLGLVRPSLSTAPHSTRRFGYKLCLHLYMDGDGSGKKECLSFFLTIMRGEYDALLPWPFQQTVTLILLDQDKQNDIVQCFCPEPTSSSFWRPRADMNVASGCP